jgi:subtilisin family serine protease
MVRIFLTRCVLGACLALPLVSCARQGTDPPLRGTPVLEQTTADSYTAAGAEAPPQSRRLHLARLGVDGWHERGQQGEGIKVAILDSGFRGYRDFLGKGLPARVQGRSFRNDHNLEARDSQHGILCGEVIHALAPRAELLLANWEPDCPAAFLQAVRWARSQGARILSCSVIMPSWSDGEGGGTVHATLEELLGSGQLPGDLLCFASAGNTAQRHWRGPYCPTRDGRHQWDAGQVHNVLYPWGRERVAVELYGGTRAPIILEVYDRETGELVGKDRLQADASSQCGQAVVRFEPEPAAVYHICVRGPRPDAMPQDDHFHLVVLGGNLERATSQGSIPFPADGARVMAVGAVDATGQRTSYSSCGPNSRRPKPDFVAPVPFPSLCRERPFSGTSAAAPQAAALAALFWSQQPQWTAAQVSAAMRAAARDLGPAGHDFETGHGLIRLP